MRIEFRVFGSCFVGRYVFLDDWFGSDLIGGFVKLCVQRLES